MIKFIARTSILLLLTLSITAQAGPPASQYSVEVVDGPLEINPIYSEATHTEFSDISSNGIAVFYQEGLDADFNTVYTSGLYDTRTGDFSILGSGQWYPVEEHEGIGVYGINAPGALVGGDGCSVVDKKGNVTYPIPSDDPVCSTRGIASNGQVSGFTIDETGIWRGFAYNPKSDNFEEFLPSPDRTLAQAINSKGEIVGGTGPREDRDGFVHVIGGSDRLFKVNIDGVRYPTAARGISDNGTIVGVFFPEDGLTHGFVGRLSNDPDDDNLIPDTVFDPNTMPECADLFISRVNNKGVISGICYGTGADFYGKGLLLTPSGRGK